MQYAYGLQQPKSKETSKQLERYEELVTNLRKKIMELLKFLDETEKSITKPMPTEIPIDEDYELKNLENVEERHYTKKMYHMRNNRQKKK
jgi:hypothetical protein